MWNPQGERTTKVAGESRLRLVHDPRCEKKHFLLRNPHRRKDPEEQGVRGVPETRRTRFRPR